VTTPIGRDIGKIFEPVGDPMIDFLFVGVGFVIGLANTLCDDLWIALAVAGVLAILTLHASSVCEKFTTEGTAHDVVKLLCDKLVSLLFVDLLLPLSHGTLAVETDIEGASVFQLLGYQQRISTQSFNL
jgi:hypothetical protein